MLQLINNLLEFALYAMWLLPFLAVYIYLKLFIDRYTVSLKSLQEKFVKRMMLEDELRNTDRRMSEIKESMGEMNRKKARAIEDFNIREMSPEKRLDFAISQGFLLHLNIPVDELEAGYITGKPVMKKSEVILPAGAYITNSVIRKLEDHEIEEVCVMFHPENPLVAKLITRKISAA
jgi:hypothetical protein